MNERRSEPGAADARVPSPGSRYLQPLLLLTLPRLFRREFGGEMLEFWHTQWTGGAYADSARGRARYRLDLSLDAVHTAWRLRISSWRGDGGSAGGNRPDLPRSRRAPLDALRRDLGFAIRSLLGTPTFSLIACSTLAIGIGANAAIFGLVNATLLSPLPYPDSDQLVRIYRTTPGTALSSAAVPDFEGWRDRTRALSAVGASMETSDTVQWEDGADHLSGLTVSADFLSLFGVRPVAGRDFTAQEHEVGGPPVVLISQTLARQRFTGQAEAIGSTMRIAGSPHTVVGVVPDTFRYPEAGTSFWRPLRRADDLRALGVDPDSRGLVFLDVVGRLASGVALRDGQADIERVTATLNASDALADDTITARLVPLHEDTVGSTRQPLLIFLAAVGLVLLIACANVAGLWMTRLAARRREMAIRGALGASTAQVARQLLVESVVLSAAGGALGIVLGTLLTDVLSGLLPPSLIPLTGGLDARVAAFTALLTIVCAVAFGLGPALHVALAPPGAGLRVGTRGGTASSGTRTTQRLLVVGQVAVAVMLLCGAALLGHSFWRLMSVNRGFDTDGVITAWVGASLDDRGGAAVRDLFDRLLPRVRALPEIESATISYSPPLAQNNFSQTVRLEDDAEDAAPRWTDTVIVGTDYFRTTGVELVAGRVFDERDRHDQAPVAIVNEAMAGSYWPGDEAIGKRFRTADGISGSVDSFDPEFFVDDWLTVIGVARDVRRRALDAAPVAEFYRPHAQMSWPSMHLVVRTRVPAAGLAGQLRDVLRGIDPAVPLMSVRSVREVLNASLSTPRLRLLLVAAFGITACLLAMLGVYAVMALSVAARTREIGIRMALGAPRRQILSNELGEGLKLVTIGCALGVPAALATSRVLAAMLFAIEPTDPLAYVGVVGVTLSVAAMACWLPARRASGLQPTAALRDG